MLGIQGAAIKNTPYANFDFSKTLDYFTEIFKGFIPKIFSHIRVKFYKDRYRIFIFMNKKLKKCKFATEQRNFSESLPLFLWLARWNHSFIITNDLEPAQ